MNCILRSKMSTIEEANRAIMHAVEQYLEDHARQFEDDLCALLRIPSVSAISQHRDDVRRAALWVAEQFRALGMPPQLHETPGHPIVYAEWLGAAGAPTVLVYGH